MKHVSCIFFSFFHFSFLFFFLKKVRCRLLINAWLRPLRKNCSIWDITCRGKLSSCIFSLRYLWSWSIKSNSSLQNYADEGGENVVKYPRGLYTPSSHKLADIFPWKSLTHLLDIYHMQKLFDYLEKTPFLYTVVWTHVILFITK